MKNVDAHDSEVISFERTRGELAISLRLWNEKLISLVFKDVFQSREIDCIGATLQKITTIKDSDFLSDAQARMSDLGCSEIELSSMKHFSLISTDDIAVLEVIGAEVEVNEC